MKIGRYEVRALSTGRFRLDGGAMFGNVPKVLWEKQHPADDRNRILMELRVLLAEGDGRRVLVDTGSGNQWSEKEQAIFGLDAPPEPGVVAALRAAGVAPESITDVVLTHLHFDHAGGVTRRGRDGAPELTFPGATHHLQRANWETSKDPNERERASYLAWNREPLGDLGGRLVLHDGPTEILPEVFVEVSEGHTTGLQTVRVGEGPGAAVYTADLLPMRAHVPVPWTMGYDLCPRTLMKEKKALLERAARLGWTVVLEHDPGRDAVRVAERAGRFEAVEDVAIV
ncbi:MAG TPA: MBL fold metallo-hydrolase [Planctomycetota bacterium]|nr:MBL fold metallo-hydrolase [Planctomycetota bacterium]